MRERAGGACAGREAGVNCSSSGSSNPRGYDGHAHDVAERIVDDVAEDDVRAGSAASWTSLEAWFISWREKFSPDWNDKSTPCAPSMLASRSGEEIAASAARIALSSPVASPMPMSAVPASS